MTMEMAQTMEATKTMTTITTGLKTTTVTTVPEMPMTAQTVESASIRNSGTNISIDTIVQIICNIFDVYVLPFLPNITTPNFQSNSDISDLNNFVSNVQPQINIIFLRQLVKNYSYSSITSLCLPGQESFECSYEQIVQIALSVFSRLHLV